MHKLAQIEQEVCDYLPVMRGIEDKSKLNEKKIENLTDALNEKD